VALVWFGVRSSEEETKKGWCLCLFHIIYGVEFGVNREHLVATADEHMGRMQIVLGSYIHPVWIGTYDDDMMALLDIFLVTNNVSLVLTKSIFSLDLGSDI